jgi:hypothetical protein
MDKPKWVPVKKVKFNPTKPAPDEGQAMQEIHEESAEPGSRSIDERVAGSYDYLTDDAVKRQLFEESERLSVLYSQRSMLDARIEEVSNRAKACEEELAMRDIPVAKTAALAPPKWLPPEDLDLWERAVARFEDAGKKPVYPGVVAVYKAYLKREGRERQQYLPGMSTMQDKPDAAGVPKQPMPEPASGEELELLSKPKVAEAPKGWEPTVKKMKKHPEIDNPYALTNWIKDKGYQPGGKKSSFTFSSVAAYRLHKEANVETVISTVGNVAQEANWLINQSDLVPPEVQAQFEDSVQSLVTAAADLSQLLSSERVHSDTVKDNTIIPF